MGERWNTLIIAGAMVIGSVICFPLDLQEGKSVLMDIVFFLLGAVLLTAEILDWLKGRKPNAR